MKVGFWVALGCLLGLTAEGQTTKGVKKVTLSDELAPLYDVSSLPLYREDSKVLQVSTYDTTGGNDDGFDGTYSFIRRNEDSSLVIFDVRGSGVIHRIWTPTPTEDTLYFFIDDADHPALSIRYSDLFSGKIAPFLSPLTGQVLGGYYCYFPILFQRSCRIVCRGKKMQFHQIQYRLYPEGTVAETFSVSLNEKEKEALQRITLLWNKKERHPDDFGGRGTKNSFTIVDASLLPGATKTVFTRTTGGRIMALKLGPADAFAGISKDIDIRITWDGESVPAVYCPAADFFGYAFGRPAMNSLLLGTQRGENYCYFPMPFDRSAKVELIYRKTSKRQTPIQCKVEIVYSDVRRNAGKEGKFYSCWRTSKLSEDDPPYVLLQAAGKGHYVGTLLQAQGLRPGMTSFFEGDDSTVIDGIPSIHGTGSEDYFNGGWYACPDRWDAQKSLPIHGALEYSLPLCRTGGYRFYLSDKLPFNKSIFQSIEHGPSAKGLPAAYTSVSFFYGNTPLTQLQQPANELCKIYIPDTLMLYPQLMQYTVWGSVNMQAVSTKFRIGGRSCIYSSNDQSRLKIALSQIPAGDYQLFADLVKYPAGCSFSVSQEQTTLTDWIDTRANENERVANNYICDIRVEDLQSSLTFHFKTRQGINSLFLNRLMLVRNK